MDHAISGLQKMAREENERLVTLQAALIEQQSKAAYYNTEKAAVEQLIKTANDRLTDYQALIDLAEAQPAPGSADPTNIPNLDRLHGTGDTLKETN